MNILQGILLPLTAWLIVLISSIGMVSIISILIKQTIILAILIQFLYLILSYLVAKYILKASLEIFAYKTCSLSAIINSSIISITISIVIAYTEYNLIDPRILKPPIPNFFNNPILYIPLAFIISPIGEETLFRGLLLGSMIKMKVNRKIAIILSAILFSAIHIIPYINANPIQIITVIFTAFILSILAGTYRVTINSIIPAIIIHACFNMGGFLITLIAL